MSSVRPGGQLGVLQALKALMAVLLGAWAAAWATDADAQPTGYVGRRLSSVAGPFRTVVERFEHCPPSPQPWPGEDVMTYPVLGDDVGGLQDDVGGLQDAVVVNVTRVSRQWGPRAQPQRLTGNLTLRQALDDSSSTLLTIDKWSGNQWKRNAFVMRLPGLCSALRGLGLLGGTPCPAQQGVYPFRDLAADWRFASMPQFYYGTWRAEAAFLRNGARRGCVRLLFKTFPAWPEDWSPWSPDADAGPDVDAGAG